MFIVTCVNEKAKRLRWFVKSIGGRRNGQSPVIYGSIVIHESCCFGSCIAEVCLESYDRAGRSEFRQLSRSARLYPPSIGWPFITIVPASSRTKKRSGCAKKAVKNWLSIESMRTGSSQPVASTNARAFSVRCSSEVGWLTTTCRPNGH